MEAREEPTVRGAGPRVAASPERAEQGWGAVRTHHGSWQGGRLRLWAAVWKQDAGSPQAPCCSHHPHSPEGGPPGRAAQAQRPALGCCGQTCWLQAPCLRPRLSSQTQDACFPGSRNTASLLAPGLAPPGGGGRSTQTHTCAHLIPASWPEHLFPTGTLRSAARRPGHWGWSGRGGWPLPLALARPGEKGGPCSPLPPGWNQLPHPQDPLTWLTRAGAVLFASGTAARSHPAHIRL